jgi:uracil-DNA glycosylase family 4
MATILPTPAEPPAAPAHDCPLCPRLVAYRDANRAANPGWFNGPVPSFGPLDAPFLVVGMAPGVRGANRTGRPFTGDHAGLLLYSTLLKFGFATGVYAERPDDGMALERCRVVNAVRCVPPQNLPKPDEIRRCNPYLVSELAAMPFLRVVMALGVLSHNATVRAMGQVPSRIPFKHGSLTTMANGLILIDCYHVSRYNTNTGVLTAAMFEEVIAAVRRIVN